MTLQNTLLITGAIVLGGCGGSTNQSIDGQWEVVFAHNGQSALSKDEYKDTRYTFTQNGGMRINEPSGVRTGTYKVDTSASPKQIDIREGNSTDYGIYEISGNELTIVTPSTETKTRPANLKPGAGVFVIKFRRVK